MRDFLFSGHPLVTVGIALLALIVGAAILKFALRISLRLVAMGCLLVVVLGIVLFFLGRR